MDPFNYGLMDPNIHGTPIFMLHLPGEALEKIVRLIKSDPHLTRAQYTQDGLNTEHLTDNDHQHSIIRQLMLAMLVKDVILFVCFSFSSKSFSKE